MPPIDPAWLTPVSTDEGATIEHGTLLLGVTVTANLVIVAAATSVAGGDVDLVRTHAVADERKRRERGIDLIEPAADGQLLGPAARDVGGAAAARERRLRAARISRSGRQ